MPELVPGLVYGTVVDNKDPSGCGRCHVRVPVLGEPYVSRWLIPAGWPGAGAPKQGSWYPTALHSQVGVLFEQGNPNAGGVFIPLHYGQEKGVNQAPGHTEAMRSGYPGENAENNTTVLWEDEYIAAYIDFQPDGQAGEERRFVIEDKKRFSRIELNVKDGVNKDTVSITIESDSSLSIAARGNLAIAGGSVFIQGRRVIPGGPTGPGGSTI